MAETVRRPSDVEPPPVPDFSFSSEDPSGLDPGFVVLITLLVLLALTIVAMIVLGRQTLGCV